MTAKPKCIKGAGCKFGACVRKAVELTSGDLLRVEDSRLKAFQDVLTSQQKARTVIVNSKSAKLAAVMRQPIIFG